MTKVRTWVGLDVHAAATVGCVVDAQSGELSVQRLSGRTNEVAAFCVQLPARPRPGHDPPRAHPGTAAVRHSETR